MGRQEPFIGGVMLRLVLDEYGRPWEGINGLYLLTSPVNEVVVKVNPGYSPSLVGMSPSARMNVSRSHVASISQSSLSLPRVVWR